MDTAIQAWKYIANIQRKNPNGITVSAVHIIELDDEIDALRAQLAAAQDECERLCVALQEIIDQCPNPKLPYGKSVLEIATDALAARPAPKDESQ